MRCRQALILIVLVAAAAGAAPNAPKDVAQPAISSLRSRDVTLSATAKAPAAMIPNDPATNKKASNQLALAAKLGPLAPITALAFSPDDKTLYLGSYGRVAVWDMQTGKFTRYLEGVEGAVHVLKFSVDGSRLAVAGGLPARSGTVLLYDGKRPTKPVATITGHEDVVYGMDFAPNGQRLATASFDKLVKVWDLKTQKEVFTIARHSDQVYAVAYSPDGSSIVSAGKDLSVKIFSAEDGKSKRSLVGHGRPVLTLGITADSKQLLSAGEETQIRWWSLENGSSTRRASGHSGGINELVFSGDRKVIASVGTDKRVHIWNPANGGQTKTLAGADDHLFAVALNSDGKRVAAGGFKGVARVWDIASGRVLAAGYSAPAHTKTPEYLTMTPEGYFTASTGVAAVVRWQIGGIDADTKALNATLVRPDEVAKSLAGEAVTPVKITPPEIKE